VFSDADVAALYDVIGTHEDPARAEGRYSYRAGMAANAVAGIGCGTEACCHHARDLGPCRRMVGPDPDRRKCWKGQAPRRIEWGDGRRRDASWDREFDLAPHDEERIPCLMITTRAAGLHAAIHTSLRDGGPASSSSAPATRRRAHGNWNRRTPRVETPPGRELRMWHESSPSSTT